jgi:hypothetical protein
MKLTGIHVFTQQRIVQLVVEVVKFVTAVQLHHTRLVQRAMVVAYRQKELT